MLNHTKHLLNSKYSPAFPVTRGPTSQTHKGMMISVDDDMTDYIYNLVLLDMKYDMKYKTQPCTVAINLVLIG